MATKPELLLQEKLISKYSEVKEKIKKTFLLVISNDELEQSFNNFDAMYN